MGHTQACQDNITKAVCAQVNYKHDWPKHCAACKGWGLFNVRGDSVPYGSTWVSLPDTLEPCETCICNGVCPRCGEAGWNGEPGGEGPCDMCGWTEKDGGMPPDPECFCWDYEPEIEEADMPPPGGDATDLF